MNREAMKALIETFGFDDLVSMGIEDGAVLDSVLAYGCMLEMTKEVFGEENLTEAVMVKAIEAASYTAYRNVMGPKDINMKGAYRL